MAPQDLKSTFVSGVLWLPCVTGLFLAACGSDGSDSTGSEASNGTTASTSSNGVTTSTAATMGPTSSTSGTATAMGSSSTASATTGAGPTTASVGSASSSGGSTGSGTTGAGGSSAAGGTTGQNSTTGQSSGGTTSTGVGGTGGNVECTRELLSTRLDEYLAALAAGDPSTLALAADLKFTENAEESQIGMTDFWMDAGEARHSQSLLDTDECTVAAHAVVPEGDVDLPIAIRIKLENGEMSEIETIVVRPGDYTASFAVDSNPQAIIDIADEVGWHETVPEGERASREELVAWIDKYFRLFPSGVCNVTGDCRRLENGGGNFGCNVGAMCSPGDPGPNDANLNPRLILADVERGMVVGLTILEGHLDMHMAKMRGGSVHAVQAILRDTDGQSGWD